MTVANPRWRARIAHARCSPFAPKQHDCQRNDQLLPRASPARQETEKLELLQFRGTRDNQGRKRVCKDKFMMAPVGSGGWRRNCQAWVPFYIKGGEPCSAHPCEFATRWARAVKRKSRRFMLLVPSRAGGGATGSAAGAVAA